MSNLISWLGHFFAPNKMYPRAGQWWLYQKPYEAPRPTYIHHCNGKAMSHSCCPHWTPDQIIFAQTMKSWRKFAKLYVQRLATPEEIKAWMSMQPPFPHDNHDPT